MVQWFPRLKTRPTRWSILTSSSEGVSGGGILVGGAMHAELYITDDPARASVTLGGMTGPVTKFKFIGAGVGLGASFLPFDVSYSDVDMTSSGATIYAGLKTDEGKQVTLDDLSGFCTIEVVAAAALAGGSITTICFGNAAEFPPFSRAVGILVGADLELPGVGDMQYVGRLWRSN